MSILDGEIRDIFGDVFGEIFDDGTLVRVVKTNGPGGKITEVPTNHACKLQRDACDQSMMKEAGYEGKDVRLLILRKQLGNIELTVDDRVVAYGETWSLKSVRKDPANSHFVARGRKL